MALRTVLNLLSQLEAQALFQGFTQDMLLTSGRRSMSPGICRNHACTELTPSIYGHTHPGCSLLAFGSVTGASVRTGHCQSDWARPNDYQYHFEAYLRYRILQPYWEHSIIPLAIIEVSCVVSLLVFELSQPYRGVDRWKEKTQRQRERERESAQRGECTARWGSYGSYTKLSPSLLAFIIRNSQKLRGHSNIARGGWASARRVALAAFIPRKKKKKKKKKEREREIPSRELWPVGGHSRTCLSMVP